MESNLALVYMTLNMIYIILIIIFNVLLIRIIITFNNFLLTNFPETKSAFSFFVCSSSCERTIRFRFRFRRCTEPNPEDPRSEGIRIAIDANHRVFRFFVLDFFQVNQFL